MLYFSLNASPSSLSSQDTTPRPGILRGMRVLDLSTIVAGPATSMILADLGADILKVERIGSGEDGRAMGPHRGPWGAYFTQLNRGKRSICVDISKPAGRETILRVAATCDVFLENFRGGKAAALGLDEASVRARKPDVVYASLSAYGPGGPDYTKPGYDALLQARTGIMSVTGIGGDVPIARESRFSTWAPAFGWRSVSWLRCSSGNVPGRASGSMLRYCRPA